MKLNDLRQIISDCCNDVIFTYNGLESGVTSEVRDYTPTFISWHGETIKEYSSVDALLVDKFFSGKSIIELINHVDFAFA